MQFETWRYEREDQFALIPLLKTIAFALPDDEKFERLRDKLKRGATNLIKRTPDIASSIVSKFLGEKTGEITKEVIESFKHEFNSKVELLAEVDRDTLYFDGFEDIEQHYNILFGIQDFTPYRRATESTKDITKADTRRMEPEELQERIITLKQKIISDGLQDQYGQVLNNLSSLSDVIREMRYTPREMRTELLDLARVASEKIKKLIIDNRRIPDNIKVNDRKDREGIMEAERAYDHILNEISAILDLFTKRLNEDISIAETNDIERLNSLIH